MDDVKSKKYTMAGRVVVRKIGTDILLVPVSGPAAGGRVFPVNKTAECIWRCLSEGATALEAARELTRKYNVEEQEAFSDCVECAEQLLAENLLAEVT